MKTIITAFFNGVKRAELLQSDVQRAMTTLKRRNFRLSSCVGSTLENGDPRWTYCFRLSRPEPSNRRAIIPLSEVLHALCEIRSCTMPKDDGDVDSTFWKQKTLLEFNQMLPEIIHDLSDMHEKHYELNPAYNWMAKKLQGKLTNGHKNRGIAVLQSYHILQNSTYIDPEMKRLVQIMGWCVEILHRSVKEVEEQQTKVKKDEVEDFSNGDVSKMLESSMYQILWKHSSNIPCFFYIMKLFQRVSHYAMLGLLLNNQTHNDKSLSQFTMNRYTTITKYKTAYGTFTLPLLVSLYMANITDEEVHRQAKTISLEMGNFYQIQKDYRNCYSTDSKHSNIAAGKCDWLSVVALQRANYYQKQLFKDNYGKDDEECVNKVKNLYDEMRIPATYKTYEDRCQDLLCTQIQQSSRGLSHDLFFKLMDRFYLRDLN